MNDISSSLWLEILMYLLPSEIPRLRQVSSSLKLKTDHWLHKLIEVNAHEIEAYEESEAIFQQKNVSRKQTALVNLRHAFSSMSAADVNELKAYKNPTGLTKDIVCTIASLLEDRPTPMPFKDSFKLIRDANFLRRIISLNIDQLDRPAARRILKAFKSKGYIAETLAKQSRCINSWYQILNCMADAVLISTAASPELQYLQRTQRTLSRLEHLKTNPIPPRP